VQCRIRTEQHIQSRALALVLHAFVYREYIRVRVVGLASAAAVRPQSHTDNVLAYRSRRAALNPTDMLGHTPTRCFVLDFI
jgi:hypothetical protein